VGLRVKAFFSSALPKNLLATDRFWRKPAVHAPVATTKLDAGRQIEHGAGRERGLRSPASPGSA